MRSKLKNSRGKAPIYKSKFASATNRVNDLLPCLTLEEKAAQTINVWHVKAQKLVDAQGNFEQSKL